METHALSRDDRTFRSDFELAVLRMRDGIPRSEIHETITRAWALAVRHFMSRSSSPTSIRSRNTTGDGE